MGRRPGEALTQPNPTQPAPSLRCVIQTLGTVQANRFLVTYATSNLQRKPFNAGIPPANGGWSLV